jgi:hypothetical protein
MIKIKHALLQRLEARGMEQCLIPGFIRTLANVLNTSSAHNLMQINKKIQYLGWHAFELDYHTLELARTCLETDGLEPFVYKPGQWFEAKFSPQQAA